MSIKQIAITTSSRTAPGAVLLERAAINLGIKSVVAVCGVDDVAAAISVSDAVLIRVGPKSYSYYESIVDDLDGDKRQTVIRTLQAFDKIASYRELAGADIAMPKSSVLLRGEAVVQGEISYPCVIKIPRGNQGRGVDLVRDDVELRQFQDLYPSESKFLLQEYIEEATGLDKRLIVAGGQFVAAMMRHASDGDFRANLHAGGRAEAYQPTQDEIDIAVRSVAVLGLSYAGVDILDSAKGPLVLEVNPSPGFTISDITGVDVASEIIKAVICERPA